MIAMANRHTVFLILFMVFAGASGKRCYKYNSYNELKWAECEHGCCGNTPCCIPSYYESTSFIVTIVCSTAVPVVMGIALCLVLRQKRQQRLARLRAQQAAMSLHQQQYPAIHVSNESGYPPQPIPGTGYPPQPIPGTGYPPQPIPMKPPAYNEVTGENLPIPPPYSYHPSPQSQQ